MTDDTPAPQEEPTEDTTTEADTTTADTAADPAKKARSEAAAYRRRLRDTEGERDALAAERDQLRARLDDRQRADVETLAGQRLQDGSDLWATDVDLASLLDDDGKPDEAKVLEAVDQLVASKPHYARPRPQFDLGVRGSTEPAAKGWGDVLRGAVSK